MEKLGEKSIIFYQAKKKPDYWLKDDLCQISSLNDEPADLNTPSGEGNKSSVKNNKIGEMRGLYFCVGYQA